MDNNRRVQIASNIEAYRNPLQGSVYVCWISITRTNEQMLSHSPYRNSIHVKFDDCTPAEIWNEQKNSNLKPMTQAQAACIAAFVRRRKEERIKTFLVSCSAGIARSSAVGLAIAEFLKDRESVDHIYNSWKYHPNPHVLKLMRAALGISLTSEEYLRLFESAINPLPW